MIQFTKKALIIFLFFSSFLLKGQTKDHVFSDYSFVNTDENYIHFYNESSNFDTFFEKLDTLLSRGKGKVKIMQIGGSHIQAEIWPDQVRKDFLQLSPEINGGRGFLFPFKIAETWNPKNFQISYTGTWKSYRNSVKNDKATWGVSGITVVTTDSISSFNIGYRSDTLTNYKFNRIKIFHDPDSTNFSVNLVSDTPVKTIKNFVIGYTEFVLKNKQDTLSVEIRKTSKIQTHFNLYGISLENDEPGIVYTSVGVNGAKTSSFLRNKLFVDQLKTVNPDLVIFCIGINDAYNPEFCTTCYEENYEQLVDWITSVNPNVEFLFVTNNDSYYKRKYPNKRVFEAREVMINLTKKYNAGMWDMFEVMGGLGSIQNWENNGFAKEDKIHFTDKGYHLLGDLMFSALMKEHNKYLKSKK